MALNFQEFNIMAPIPEAHRSSDIVLASYDTVNRMVGLIGNIPFRNLFTQPFDRLVADHLLPHAREAASIQPAGRPALVAHFDPVAGHLDVLRSSSKLSFREILAPGVAADSAVVEALVGLRGHGIFLPGPDSGARRSAATTQTVVDKLIADAGDYTYLDVYSKGKASLPAETASKIVEAVRAALDYGLLFQVINYQCCQSSADGSLSSCRSTMLQLGCSPDMVNHVGCAMGSQTCGRAPRRRP